LILDVQALCQIHRRIASGMRVENWIMEDGLVTRTDDRGNDPLQERLEYVPPELHLNADEKPLLPDSPVSKTLTFSTEKLTSIASGRTKSWTVHMFIRANGVMDIPPLVIMRGDSISSDILEAIVGTNIQVTATLIDKVIELCRKNHTYFVLQPSHTSMIHQPLDNGINAPLLLDPYLSNDLQKQAFGIYESDWYLSLIGYIVLY